MAAKNKTTLNDESVDGFLQKVPDEKKRKDCFELAALIKDVSGQEPKMWGTAIVGFGSYHYKYESGREGDSPVVGFSPRKNAISVYLMGGLAPIEKLLEKLGKHKTGKGCLYINNLADIDKSVMKKIVDSSFRKKKPA